MITIELRNVSSGRTGTSGGHAGYVEGSGTATSWGEDRVDFSIRNSGDTDATITHIKIDSSDSSLESLREGAGGSYQASQHEIYIASSTPGIYEASGDLTEGNDPGNNAYQLGTKVALTQHGVLASGQSARVTMLLFRNTDGDTVSAADKPLTVTLYFQDGSSTTFTFTPPGY